MKELLMNSLPIDMLTPVERKHKRLKLNAEEATGYKRKQVKYKLINFERVYFPKVFWGGKKGTYRKPKEKNV